MRSSRHGSRAGAKFQRPRGDSTIHETSAICGSELRSSCRGSAEEQLDERHCETHELTATEQSAIEKYGEPWRHFEDVSDGTFRQKGSQARFWKDMRAGLRAIEGVRRPQWIDDIEASGIELGKTIEAREHTMYGLELAAAGGGFYWRVRHKDAENLSGSQY